MKSVLQACWLLTVAFGNLIVAVIADLKIFPQQSHEFFFFSALMIMDIIIFAIMAYFYVPFQGNNSSTSDVNENEKESMQLEPVKSKTDWAEWCPFCQHSRWTTSILVGSHRPDGKGPLISLYIRFDDTSKPCTKLSICIDHHLLLSRLIFITVRLAPFSVHLYESQYATKGSNLHIKVK